jgi:hypothetical protein
MTAKLCRQRYRYDRVGGGRQQERLRLQPRWHPPGLLVGRRLEFLRDAVGTGNGQFVNPVGIAVDTGNNIWVVDNDTRIQEFNNSGTFQKVITMPASAVAGGIYIDSGNNLWITDTVATHHVAYEYNTGGTLLMTFGSANLSGPWGITAASVPGSSCAAAANCTTPWNATLLSGYSVYAYSSNSSVPPGTCPAANTLSCSNGTLTCTLNGGGTGVAGTDCAYQTCYAGCSLPWGGGIANGSNATASQNATENYNTNGNSATCVNSQTRTCNNGTLTGSYGVRAVTEQKTDISRRRLAAAFQRLRPLVGGCPRWVGRLSRCRSSRMSWRTQPAASVGNP